MGAKPGTGRIIQSYHNVTFGMGGPYKLVDEPAEPLRGLAWRYTQLEALRRHTRRDGALASLEGRKGDAGRCDRDAASIAEPMMMAGASLVRSLYSTGNRWSVVAVGGWYVHLDRGMDDDGAHYEPRLRCGRVQGLRECPGCSGVGRRHGIGLEAGKVVRCFTCEGSGFLAVDVPACLQAKEAAVVH